MAVVTNKQFLVNSELIHLFLLGDVEEVEAALPYLMLMIGQTRTCLGLFLLLLQEL